MYKIFLKWFLKSNGIKICNQCANFISTFIQCWENRVWLVWTITVIDN